MGRQPRPPPNSGARGGGAGRRGVPRGVEPFRVAFLKASGIFFTKLHKKCQIRVRAGAGPALGRAPGRGAGPAPARTRIWRFFFNIAHFRKVSKNIQVHLLSKVFSNFIAAVSQLHCKQTATPEA